MQHFQHPYIGRIPENTGFDAKGTMLVLNKGRDNTRGACIRAVYYFEVETEGTGPGTALAKAAQMLLEHGTVKPWQQEGDARYTKPDAYDENMSWIEDITLFSHSAAAGVEDGTLTIAYPLHFFDKTTGQIPLSQMFMAIASEPFSAFSFYRGAKLIDLIFPEEFKGRFPGIIWPHSRVREYLEIGENEPIIGTIVKPKAGLTPELFSNSVVEAALAGARFTKADENMHLRIDEIPLYVSRVVQDLQAAGFDLGRGKAQPGKKRFLFAPHITHATEDMFAAAQAAVEAGANALMFSPYYGGGFERMAQISKRWDIPVYAHTAGMNVFTGAYNWGIDHSVLYRLAALYSGAFMQLTAVNGYLRPSDTEKGYILEKLKRDKLEVENGFTLVIAGGLGPANIGLNMRELGVMGRMFLAGTSVYSHPLGAGMGVRALVLAYRAFTEKKAVEKTDILAYARSLGEEGYALVAALEGVKT